MSKKQSNNNRGQWQVILLNDTNNTVPHVIACLMEICGQSYLQAVQCATITHQTGQCSIFVDSWDECDQVQTELSVQGLLVTVLEYKKHV